MGPRDREYLGRGVRRVSPLRTPLSAQWYTPSSSSVAYAWPFGASNDSDGLRHPHTLRQPFRFDGEPLAIAGGGGQVTQSVGQLQRE